MIVFIIDKAIILFIGVGLYIYTPNLVGQSLTIIIRAAIVIMCGSLCKSLVLLPIDFILGKRKRICVFITCTYWKKYEMFRNRCYCCYYFITERNNIHLIVPVSCRITEISTIEVPPRNQEIEITYYRVSRVLCKWEPVDIWGGMGKWNGAKK